jgi:hypothetical protein
MAIKLGTENKRQVYLAVGLFVAIIGLIIYEYGGSSTPTAPKTATEQRATTAQSKASVSNTSPAKTQTTAGTQGQQTGPAAEKVASLNIDPALHLSRLAYTEAILYEGRGRNIFSADSVPMADIETPIGSPRVNQPTTLNGNKFAYEPPKAPPIDLKYFGYTLSKDKSFRAFFVRGDDIFVARTGEIVDHVYKVGTITTTNVQVTDLGHNDTQSVPLTGSTAVGNRE